MRRWILLTLAALACGASAHAACSNTAFGAATCIHAASNTNASSGSSVITTLSTTAGHLYVLQAQWCQNSSCNSATTSSNGTIAATGCTETFHVAAASTADLSFSGVFMAVKTWYVFNSAGSCTSFTITVTGSPFYMQLAVSEWSGPSSFSQTDSYDKGGTAIFNPCTTCTVSTSSSTTHATELIIGFENNGGQTATPVSPAIVVVVNATNGRAFVAANTVSSTGTQSMSWTQSSSSAQMALATFNLGSPIPRKKMGPF